MGFWKSQVIQSRVKDKWLDKNFVSHVISKTPYSRFRIHSISIVEKYKQAIRNYKWKEISHVTVEVIVEKYFQSY
jgi:uncharacterized protein (UPF0262 family)